MSGLQTTAQVADVLNVRPSWVREHAAELGAIRLGRTDRGELRFDPDRVHAWLERRRLEQYQPARPARRPGPQRRALGGAIPASTKEW